MRDVNITCKAPEVGGWWAFQDQQWAPRPEQPEQGRRGADETRAGSPGGQGCKSQGMW